MKTLCTTVFVLCIGILSLLYSCKPLSNPLASGGVLNWKAIAYPIEAYSINAVDQFFIVDTSTYYLTGSNRIFRTRDGGLTWTNSPIPVSAFPEDSTIGTLNLAPNGMLYSFRTDNWYSSNGISGAYTDLFRSLDSGATWTHLNVPGATTIYSWNMVIAPNNYVYIAQKTGLIRSTDNGTTWQQIVTTSPINFWETSVAVAQNGTLYMAISGQTNYSILRSTTNGNTWDTINAGLPPVSGNSGFGALFSGVSPSGVVYLKFGYSNVPQGIQSSLYDLPVSSSVWQLNGNGLPNVLFGPNAMIFLTNSTLICESFGFNFVSSDGLNWETFDDGLPNPAILVGCDKSQYLYAQTGPQEPLFFRTTAPIN